MTLDTSNILYLLFLLFIIGVIVRFGQVVVSLVLLGLATVFIIFALLLITDLLTGGSALHQIALASVPVAATFLATIAAWLRLRTFAPPPGKYD